MQVRRQGFPPVSATFDTKAEARIWAGAKEHSFDLVLLNPQNGMTIRALLQRYLETVSVKKRSLLTEKSTIRALCNDPISNCYLSELKPAVIAEYRDRRLKEVKPSTVNRQMSILKHCISIARSEWGIEISSNPFDVIKLPPLSEGRDRRLKDGEWELIKLHAPKARNRLLLPIIEFAIETGMRQGEILGLRWENINFESRLAFLPLTKNGSSRKVPLSLRAVAILSGLQRDQALVFPICRKTTYSAWSSLMGRTGIEGLRFHDLRHEAISRFFERGLSLPEVAAISGHKSYKMLFRYTHMKPEEIALKLNW